MDQDQQKTSQGEYIVSSLSDMWQKVVSTTEAAAHKAGEAVHAIQETTAGLLDKGLEKAHDVVVGDAEAGKAAHADEPNTKERSGGVPVFEFASILMETAKEQAKETASEHIARTPEPSPSAIAALVAKTEEVLHSLASSGADVLERASHAVAPVAEQVVEQVTPVVEKAVDVVAPVVEKAKSVAAPLVEKAVDAAAPVVNKVVEVAAPVVDKVVDAATPVVDKVVEVAAPVVDTVVDAAAPIVEKAADVVPSLRRSNSNKSLKKSPSKQSVNLSASEEGFNPEALVLTMDVVSHIQRIADRTGDAVLHETARKAHSACAKGLNEAPGVHLTWVTLQQANDLVNLAIRTQDHELADFARYCQSVAATTHIAVEPSPGKIQEEILKGHQELQKQGRVHSGPGYGAAFASVNKIYPLAEGGEPLTLPNSDTNMVRSGSVKVRPQVNAGQQPELVLTMEVVSHIQRIADRTGNVSLHDMARRAHSAFAKGLNEAAGVHLVHITLAQASELMNIASRSDDKDTIDFARYYQSVASTTQVGVEPNLGKISDELLKGREQQPLQQETTQQETQQQQEEVPQQVTQQEVPQQQIQQAEKQLQQEMKEQQVPQQPQRVQALGLSM